MDTRPALLVSVGLLILMFLLSAWAWLQLEPGASVPVHWGVDGNVDRYGGKVEGLLLLPLITSAIVILFAVIPRVEPRRLNLQRSRVAYGWIWIATVGFLAGMHVVAILAAMGRVIDMSLVVSIGLGLMYVIIGIALPRVESNYHVGFRTPWTLASDESWQRTHRLAGRLFALLGVATIVSIAAGDPGLTLAIGIGGVLLLLVITTVYSYRVWRDDPDKDQTGR